MEAVFPTQVSAAQVGTHFVGQYYHILYQFYTEASTMVRVDGAAAETASGMMIDTALVLHEASIFIKTLHEQIQGEVEFRSILYLPAVEKDEIMNSKTKNIRLYVKRVFISD